MWIFSNPATVKISIKNPNSAFFKYLKIVLKQQPLSRSWNYYNYVPCTVFAHLHDRTIRSIRFLCIICIKEFLCTNRKPWDWPANHGFSKTSGKTPDVRWPLTRANSANSWSPMPWRCKWGNNVRLPCSLPDKRFRSRPRFRDTSTLKRKRSMNDNNNRFKIIAGLEPTKITISNTFPS